MKFILIGLITLAPVISNANDDKPSVKYGAGKEINLEQLVIEGQLKRPELGVVTGDSDQNSNGLIKIRENFVDLMEADAGQEISGGAR